MAARKTTKALTTQNNSALAPAGALNEEWQEKLKGYAQRDSATASGATGWPYIHTSPSGFKFNDALLEEMPPVIILGAAYENTYYAEKYNSEDPKGPACFALSRTEEGLAPPEGLGDRRQGLHSEPASETCMGCWANQFGSADTGRGKACKNIRRLALLPADKLDARTLGEIEGAMLRLPVTSVKNFSTFANKVTKGLGIPLFVMRARIHIVPDTKSQYKVTFEPYDMEETDDGLVPMLVQDAKLLSVLEGRVKEADTFLDHLPSLDADEAPTEEKKPAGPRATPRKAGGRKKTTRSAAKY